MKSDLFSSDEEVKNLLSTRTGSILNFEKRPTDAWHIAYLQSNPAEDISVTLTKRAMPWRYALADSFFKNGYALYACLAFAVISWILTALLIIRPRYRREGIEPQVWKDVLRIILWSQLFGLIIVIILSAFTLLFFAAPILFYYLWEERKSNRKSWFPLTAWLYSILFFVLLALPLYGFLRWCEAL